jgi:hypothetical protein
MINEETKLIERTYDGPDTEIKLGAYLVRESFYESMIHKQDDLKNIGFNWRPNLMIKTLSAYLLSNTNVSQMVEQYQKLMVYLVERVQDIKKSANYTVDKHYKYIT